MALYNTLIITGYNKACASHQIDFLGWKKKLSEREKNFFAERTLPKNRLKIGCGDVNKQTERSVDVCLVADCFVFPTLFSQTNLIDSIDLIGFIVPGFLPLRQTAGHAFQKSSAYRNAQKSHTHRVRKKLKQNQVDFPINFPNLVLRILS